MARGRGKRALWVSAALLGLMALAWLFSQNLERISSAGERKAAGWAAKVNRDGQRDVNPDGTPRKGRWVVTCCGRVFIPDPKTSSAKGNNLSSSPDSKVSGFKVKSGATTLREEEEEG